MLLSVHFFIVFCSYFEIQALMCKKLNNVNKIQLHLFFQYLPHNCFKPFRNLFWPMLILAFKLQVCHIDHNYM